MVVKFEVGKVYFSTDPIYNEKGNVVSRKNYWLCVKRNDSTRYVSFKRIYKGKVLNTVDSRKANIVKPFFMSDSSGKIPEFEEIQIGYGGTGYWRNYHIISAVNVATNKVYAGKQSRTVPAPFGL